MGQAKRRGTYQQRKVEALDVVKNYTALLVEAGNGMRKSYYIDGTPSSARRISKEVKKLLLPNTK